VSQPGIGNAAPSSSTAEGVYSLDDFEYGAHILRVDLVSWTATDASHFRVDRAIIDETLSVTSTTIVPITDVSTVTSSIISTSQSLQTPSLVVGRITKK
jgi:hypothetical protein